MPTQTQTSVAEPEVLSPQWLYDTLMEVIEPDLVSANVQKLDELYKNEADDDREARMERYQWAFFILDECLEDIKDEMKQDASVVEFVMRQVAELQTGADDQRKMEELEKNFSDSDQ